MKVIRLRLKNLQNEEWFNLCTELKSTVESFGEENLGFQALYQRFLPLYATADTLLEILRKSIYTQKIENLDRMRQDLFRALYGMTKIMKKQPEPTRKVAAHHLYNLLRSYYKNVIDTSYAKKSSTLYNLMQDLHGDYAADISLLNLSEWVTPLEKAEQDFLELYRKRRQENINKPKENLLEIRRQAELIYTAMMNHLDGQLLADGLGGNRIVNFNSSDASIICKFVIRWNEVAKRYRNMLAHRAGIQAKSKIAGAD
ncbi:MAG: DUF6261 family protein [Tannerellaceae bacterium]|jgi:hypothetical protein|nr:DUF6261 family protein [Tannerellaceae bacterium]